MYYLPSVTKVTMTILPLLIKYLSMFSVKILQCQRRSRSSRVRIRPYWVCQRSRTANMATAVREDFRNFVLADCIAVVFSMCAIAIYNFLAPCRNKMTIQAYLFYGYAQHGCDGCNGVGICCGPASCATSFFIASLEVTISFILPVFLLFF